MSLIKYTVFINSLLVDLKNSKTCCMIYKTPSTPVGYADDLAAACRSKLKMDRVMEIVYAHGRTWRYDFNARKSGVLVFGETSKEHTENTKNRTFRLGQEKVRERTNYDHVGVNVSILSGDDTGIRERLSKARRSLNALTGLGIRRCGLTVATCNVLFWAIVVPIALYGCELWSMAEEQYRLLESFQNYVCKKIQRFHPRVPNACSMHSLGWINLSRLVQVKKLLFVRSILAMDHEDVIRVIFIERYRAIKRHVCPDGNYAESIVFNLLDVVNIFKLNEEVDNMVERDHLYQKSTWKKIVWDRAWSLEDMFWKVEYMLQKSLDLVSSINSSPRYLTWWALSDKYPEYMYMCETMSRLVCHASLLRMDDLRLKKSTMYDRCCPLCCLTVPDNVYHLVMQCPSSERRRREMFSDIEHCAVSLEARLNENPEEILPLLLGKCKIGYSFEQMEELWIVAGIHIHRMYRENLTIKRGIG